MSALRPSDGATSGAGPMLMAERFVSSSRLYLYLCDDRGVDESSTGSTCDLYRLEERTVSAPSGWVRPAPLLQSEACAEAVLEIRRRSGLTWEELADLFGVSRRTMHSWANGEHPAAENDQRVRKMLAAVRHLDCGEASQTRARLLDVDARGSRVFDRLKKGAFAEVMVLPAGSLAQSRKRTPLSQAERDGRRPPAPALLLDALQDAPPALPGKVRIGRAVREPKVKG